MNPGKMKQWKQRRQGSLNLKFQSSVESASSKQSEESLDIEEEFLHAAEFGDIHNVRRIMEEFPDLNVECMDALGRTALRLAVKNEHLEVVEALLERSNKHHIYEAVLQAISAGHSQIAETILKHRRYMEMWRERRKLGDTDGFYKTSFADSQFSADITPIILASQMNQYEIVQLLLLRGETIQKPHKFSCACLECRNRIKFDQLRVAKYRLNAYRGLGSDAYISLSSKDPILTAFKLAAELRRLSKVEKHFKREYRDLADQLSDFVVKLVDRIRTQKELELILNKTGEDHEEKYSSLARFKLALKYKEKKFVAHPSCQQRVVQTWYNGMGKLERATWPKRIIMTSLFIAAYPVLVFLHLFFPKTKGAKILQFPVVKFLTHAMSFFGFLILIVVSTAESFERVSRNRTLLREYPREHDLYNAFRMQTNNTVYGPEFPLRPSSPSFYQIMMSLWIFGMICQECYQLLNTDIVEHLKNMYNLQDFVLISVYTATFTLKYWTMFKFHQSIRYLNRGDFSNERLTLERIYWLNADRVFWAQNDPINMAEGQFAIANILNFSRVSYLLTASEILGPLQISLGRMMKDIAKFLVLFVLVLMAFLVGLHNLYWYYSEREYIELDLADGPDSGVVKAGLSFGGAKSTFRTAFWALFGRGEPSAVELGGYENDFTESIGYILYGSYNILMVTVLLNMLIGMMTRSFTLIAEDSDREWKFARSLLYMDYICKGDTLPAPLNILGTIKAFVRFVSRLFPCCSFGTKQQVEEEVPGQFDPTNPLGLPAPGVGKQNSPRGAAHNISKDTTAIEMHEIGGRINAGFEGTPKSVPRRNAVTMATMGTEERLTYQQTMQRIVQRYIFDIQREAEVNEDDFEELKQDISSFRYDLINQMNSKQAIEEDLKVSTLAVMEQLQSLKRRLIPRSKDDDEVKGKPVEGRKGGQTPYHTGLDFRIGEYKDIIEEEEHRCDGGGNQQDDQQDNRQDDQKNDQWYDQQDDQPGDLKDDHQDDQQDDQLGDWKDNHQDDQQDDQQDYRQDDQQNAQQYDQQDDQLGDWKDDHLDGLQDDQHNDQRYDQQDDQLRDWKDNHQDDQQDDQQRDWKDDHQDYRQNDLENKHDPHQPTSL